MKKIILAVLLATLSASAQFAHADDVIPINETFEPAGTFDPARFGKVAVVQWNGNSATPIGVTPKQAEQFKMRNRKEIEAYVREAASNGAEMVITPEFSIVGYPDIP